MTEYNNIPCNGIVPCDGGVCAAKGFKATGIHAGLRKNKDKLDLALICAEKECNAAGVFTTNRVFAAPVGVTRAHLKNGKARAAICNSGNANACCTDGYEKAEATCAALAEKLGIQADDVIVASTGVIGVSLPIEPLVAGIPTLIDTLSDDCDASDRAASAIMTTDTKKKEFAFEMQLGDKIARIGGICKGSGMIQPNMATMLCFITTDANISSEMLQKALSEVICDTFNMVSVDGDTSTNDMVTVMASGLAGNDEIAADCTEFEVFKSALKLICTKLCTAIAADGEGATKLIECDIRNFSDSNGARVLAKSVINSSLVKTAMFGADANWGRVLCALGYAGLDIDTSKIDVKFISDAGEILVCENGCGYPFSEEKAKDILLRDSITIDVDMKSGDKSAKAWGCDLSYEYVHINGDYRS
ncbi:MAG: bifunctional glutamate N-acetyltransferase/amino-acid acetyltransferase ArgJ [Clostridiales bacterium]|nr:bifunctional glutamate N-acetyltransferase/amino-acid acetyltransferase ArgJ [Clostridiales bacterium]